MTGYDVEAWRRLGKLIRRQREKLRIDTDEWASQVDRSSRVLLGLERGEKTGDKTLRRVEELLGWTEGSIDDILAGGEPTLLSEQPSQGRPLSVVPSSMEPVLVQEDNEVLAAIRRDPELDEDSRAHFLNQYALLRELSRRKKETGPVERLPYVAHGKRQTDVDPEEERAIEERTRDAVRRNPESPHGKK